MNIISKKEMRLFYEEIYGGYIEKNSWLLECPKGHRFRINSSMNLKDEFLINAKCPKCINEEHYDTIPIISLSVDQALKIITQQIKIGKAILEKESNMTEHDYDSWHKENLLILNNIFLKHPLIAIILDSNLYDNRESIIGVVETVDMKLNRIKVFVDNELNKLDLIKVTIQDLIIRK